MTSSLVKGIIVVLATIILFILLTRVSSTYGTPANDPSISPQPIFVGTDYQDIDDTVAPWTTPANYQLDPGTTTWAQANINCWAKPNCSGIRHNFDTRQTWYLMQPIGSTKTAVQSVLTPKIQYNGQYYKFPLTIVANKSISQPMQPLKVTGMSSGAAPGSTGYFPHSGGPPGLAAYYGSPCRVTVFIQESPTCYLFVSGVPSGVGLVDVYAEFESAYTGTLTLKDFNTGGVLATQSVTNATSVTFPRAAQGYTEWRYGWQNIGNTSINFGWGWW